MTISKRDAKLLLMLLGIVVFLLGYFLVYSEYTERTEEINSQITGLTATVQELRAHEAMLDTYYAGIDQAQEITTEQLALYPVSVRSEDLVMYAISMEQQVGINVTDISFPGTSALATFQTAQEADGQTVTRSLTAYQTGMTVSANMSYAQFKDVIPYINESDGRTSLETMSISFDAETGALTGSIALYKYYVAAGDEEIEPTRTPSVPLGTTDLFSTYSVSQSQTETEAPVEDENAGQ